MTEIRFRKIETRNIAELIEIAESTGLSHWSAQNYIDEQKNPNAMMLRLESDENSTIGFIVGRIVPASDDELAVDAEIYNIAVVETHQRQGNGQLLLDEFIRNCLLSNVRHLWLEVRASNGKAIAFYTSRGFLPITRRRDFYNDPVEDAILMRLDDIGNKRLSDDKLSLD